MRCGKPLWRINRSNRKVNSFCERAGKDIGLSLLFCLAGEKGFF